MLGTSQGDLCRCSDVVNTMLKLEVGVIQKYFQKSVVNIDHRYNTPFYSRVHSFVLRQCIQHNTKELEKIKIVGSDKVACGYFIRITHVLPCKYELGGL